MDFELTQDQKMLVDTVKSFVRKDSPVSRARALLEQEDGDGYDRAVLAQMGELGWLGVALPEDVGGFGGRFVDVALVLERLASTLAPEPVAASYLGARAIADVGSDAQKARWAAPAVEGKSLVVLATVEANNRFDPLPAAVTAERDGEALVLRGEKRWVVAGNVADAFIVSARAGDEVVLVVVDRDAAGLSVTSVKTVDGRRAAMLTLAGVRVEPAGQLCAGERAASELELLADLGAAASCAEAVGLMQAVLDMTSEYLKTREQFGEKIGTFQALQHRAVDMFVECQLARSASLLASLMVDEAGSVPERMQAVSTAKSQVVAGGRYVTQQAIQLHGGIGITHEADVGLYFKRMQVLATLYGDDHYHLGRFVALPTFTRGVAGASADGEASAKAKASAA